MEDVDLSVLSCLFGRELEGPTVKLRSSITEGVLYIFGAL
jgi:hypothetical protein